MSDSRELIQAERSDMLSDRRGEAALPGLITNCCRFPMAAAERTTPTFQIAPFPVAALIALAR